MKALSSALPQIRRARGYFVYSHDGKKYLDCYLNGGRALLGHRPAHVSTIVKDAVSTGSYAEYPSPYAGRLETLLREMLPSHPVVRLYADFETARRAAAVACGTGGSIPGDSSPATSGYSPHDPAMGPAMVDSQSGTTEGRFWLWRPFLGREQGVLYEVAAGLLPVVPFPGAWCGQAICVRPDYADSLAPSATLSPVALAAHLRALQTLYAVMRTDYSGSDSSLIGEVSGGKDQSGPSADRSNRGRRPDPDTPRFPPKPPVLACFSTNGPYLVPRCRGADYTEVFYTFLQNRIILHPGPEGPSVWPAETGTYYRKKFVELDLRCGRKLGLSPTKSA